jgi:hypothetical protein
MVSSCPLYYVEGECQVIFRQRAKSLLHILTELQNQSGYFLITPHIYLGFEVLTGVVMKNSIFWDIMLCSPLKVNRHCSEMLVDYPGSMDHLVRR